MGRYRIAFGVVGAALIGLGVFRLLTNLSTHDLVVLGLWLAVAVALHDGVVAPLTVGTGVLLTRVPARARRYVQGGLVAAALVTVVAIPLVARRDTQPTAEAILLRDYTANLALLLCLVAAVATGSYAARVVREKRLSGTEGQS